MIAMVLRPMLRHGLLSLSLTPLIAISAQHAPLIERQDATAIAAPATSEPSPSPQAITTAYREPAAAPVAATPAQTKRMFGDSTRQLLQMQAEGNHAGQILPILGEAASRSYQRYLDSFDHPIPEYFEATLPSNKGQGSGP